MTSRNTCSGRMKCRLTTTTNKTRFWKAPEHNPKTEGTYRTHPKNILTPSGCRGVPVHACPLGHKPCLGRHQEELRHRHCEEQRRYEVREFHTLAVDASQETDHAVGELHSMRGVHVRGPRDGLHGESEHRRAESGHTEGPQRETDRQRYGGRHSHVQGGAQRCHEDQDLTLVQTPRGHITQHRCHGHCSRFRHMVGPRHVLNHRQQPLENIVVRRNARTHEHLRQVGKSSEHAVIGQN